MLGPDQDQGVVHLPRRLSLGAITVGFLFVASQIWAASALFGDVASVKQAYASVLVKIDRLEEERLRLVRVEEKVNSILLEIREIKRELRNN